MSTGGGSALPLEQADFDRVVREDGPVVRGALVASFRDFELAEDVLQEALLAAAERWPVDGWPESPRAWLLTVARRKALDTLRRSNAHQEVVAAAQVHLTPTSPERLDNEELELILLCCHPALELEAQVALTLQAVGGLSADQVARAFLVPTPTMSQRLVRAKRRLREVSEGFSRPVGPALPTRLEAVRTVIYLLFTEGYAPRAGEQPVDVDLCELALGLARRLARLAPAEHESHALVCLILLHHARRATRRDPLGDLVLLADQDRSRWDGPMIAEATTMLVRLLSRGGVGRVGRYALEAAIAAVHAEAPSPEETDWLQIVCLYDRLLLRWPSPVVALNRAVAVAHARGPEHGLADLEAIGHDPHLLRSHLYHAARAELQLALGQVEAAQVGFSRALALAPNGAGRRYLGRRLLSLRPNRWLVQARED